MKTIDLSREIATARSALAAPFFTWLAMVTYSIVAYTLMASAPLLGNTTWTDAARLGTGWWMTAFGGEATVEQVPISLMPMTITLIVIYASYVAFRKREVDAWSHVAFAGIAQAGVVGVIGLLLVRPDGAWWPAVIGAFGIGATTATFAARYHLLRWEPLYSAYSRTRLLLGALAIIAGAIFILGVGLGWSRILQIHGFYLTGVIGSIGLVLLQLAYLPVGLVWALAWVLGAGFSVGEGTQFSVLGVESAPLPAIPLLGALPQVSDGAPWVLAIIAALFIIFGIVATRRDERALLNSLINGAVASVIASLTVAVLGLMASGAIGPERMATTGPVPAELFGFTLLLVGLPFMVGTLLSHDDTIAYLRAQLDELKAKRTARKEAAAEEAAAEEASVAGDELDVAGDEISGMSQPAPTADRDVDR